MEDKVIAINLGIPCETPAEEVHDALLQLPAVTYLHVYRLMSEIINHSYYKTNQSYKENDDG